MRRVSTDAPTLALKTQLHPFHHSSQPLLGTNAGYLLLEGWQQLLQVVDGHRESFHETHFNHLFHALQGIIVDRNADCGNSVLRAEIQIPIGTGQIGDFHVRRQKHWTF
jgi:hypothetical protein